MEQNKLTASDIPELTVYQKLLLEEIKNNKDLMHLFKVIFDDYPSLVIQEREALKGATNRRQRKGIELGSLRMKMEAYIEEKIAILSGIDIEGMKRKQEEYDKEQKEKEIES